MSAQHLFQEEEMKVISILNIKSGCAKTFGALGISAPRYHHKSSEERVRIGHFILLPYTVYMNQTYYC